MFMLMSVKEEVLYNIAVAYLGIFYGESTDNFHNTNLLGQAP